MITGWDWFLFFHLILLLMTFFLTDTLSFLLPFLKPVDIGNTLRIRLIPGIIRPIPGVWLLVKVNGEAAPFGPIVYTFGEETDHHTTKMVHRFAQIPFFVLVVISPQAFEFSVSVSVLC